MLGSWNDQMEMEEPLVMTTDDYVFNNVTEESHYSTCYYMIAEGVNNAVFELKPKTVNYVIYVKDNDVFKKYKK